MDNKSKFKKLTRKAFSFFEEEGFEPLLHQNGIMYRSEEKDFEISLYFDTSYIPFKIRSLWIERAIHPIEEIIKKTSEDESNISPYTVRVVWKDFSSLGKKVLLDGFNEALIIEDSDLELTAQMFKNLYCGQEGRDITLESINNELIKCDNLDDFSITFFNVDGHQYLRAYIVGKLCQNQQVIDWIEGSTVAWMESEALKGDNYWATRLQQILRVKAII
jgi:hypothetical protein